MPTPKQTSITVFSSDMLVYFLKIANNKKVINNIAKTKAIGIHNGAVTHHHDQFATSPIFANFITKKTTNKIVPKPIEVLVVLLFSILIYFSNSILQIELQSSS